MDSGVAVEVVEEAVVDSGVPRGVVEEVVFLEVVVVVVLGVGEEDRIILCNGVLVLHLFCFGDNSCLIKRIFFGFV